MTRFRTISWFERLKRFALGVDASLDHGAHGFAQRLRDLWIGYANALDGLHTRGFQRFAVNAASEAATLGLAGAVVMLALAQPAFRDTEDENWLKRQDLAVTFLDRYGMEVGKRGIRHDDSVKLDDLPDHFIKAVLATEDRRFYEHFGIDPIGTIRALVANSRASGVVQGGSSITQQLAKNLFLTNERSLERKIREAFLALWLESRLTKQEILKLYLDRAYMGGGAFGVQAAAEFYFGKSVKDLTLAESAMMAGLFKAPTKFAPHINLPAARGRASDVLSNMVEAGFMTEGQVYAAKRNPATAIDRRRDATPDYYLDWAFRDVKKLADSGKLGQERVLVVRTPLDLNIQRRSEAALEAVLRQHGDNYEVESGAVVVMDIDGAMRALVGGRDYGVSQFNRAADAQRAPGSSFKPYVYAAAIEAGKVNRNSTVVDRPVCIGNWCPQNYGRSFSGSMPITTAMAKSINSIPVQLSIAIGQDQHPNHVGRAARAGRDTIVQLLRKMGVTSEMKDTPSMPIGSVEMTVVEMAQSYAAFPNAGRRVEPYAALEVRNTRGELVYRHDRDAVVQPQIMRPQTAADMNYLMSKVPEEGTARRAALPGIRSAGKTGTTDEYRNAWYVGYTGNYVTAVWLGNDDYSPTNNMTGGSLPAMVWHEIMVYAHEGLDLKPIYGLTPLERPAAGGVNQRPATAPLVTSTDRPVVLNRRVTDALGAIENTMRATQTQATGPVPQVGGFEVLAPSADGAGPRSLANRAVGGLR